MSTSKNYNSSQEKRAMKRLRWYTLFSEVGSIAGVPVKLFFTLGRSYELRILFHQAIYETSTLLLCIIVHSASGSGECAQWGLAAPDGF
jgi:hypothetical protein